MDVSIIVPLYNEAASVVPLYNGIVSALDPLGLEYEILFVDDGSEDSTFPKAKKLAEGDPRLRVIKFRRNYGQTPAMVAGIEHARGSTLVTMDGDLQNDPADIPHFISRICEGYDIVVGWRFERQDKLLTRKIPSKVANWVIGKVTGVPIKDNGCSLKAYRSEIIRNIPLYSEMHRFIPAMTSLAGTKILEIKVQHHARQYGRSKYGLSRTYKVLLDLLVIKTILSFFSRPLLAFVLAGAVAITVSLGLFALGVFHIVWRPEQPSVVLLGMGLLYAILAIVLVFWGFLGELVYRTGDVKVESFARLTVQVADREHGKIG